MKFFSLLVALLALALPVGLVLSQPHGELFTDRGASAPVAAADQLPAGQHYAQR